MHQIPFQLVYFTFYFYLLYSNIQSDDCALDTEGIVKKKIEFEKCWIFIIMIA